METEGKLYVVMELCRGEQLFDVVAHAQGGRLGEGQCARLFRQLVQAVGTVHSAGYLHRDLKPENVMCVGDDMTLKIIDFGVRIFSCSSLQSSC